MRGIVLGIKHKKGVFNKDGESISYDFFTFICGVEISDKVGAGWELAIDEEPKMKIPTKYLPDVLGVSSEKEVYDFLNAPVDISINKYGRYDRITRV